MPIRTIIRMALKITSRDIEKAIDARHIDEIVVHQCKTGASGSGVNIMDTWVMPKSWAHPDCTAYEIKVSRSDFMADKKWHKYLDYCNYFYFVCPWKMIDPKEVPYGAGLCYLSQTGTKLFTKVKAPRRAVKIPEDLWRYVLMCRTEITRDRAMFSEKVYWENWLKDKKRDRDFGMHVSKSINEFYKANVDKVEQKQRQLDKDIARYKWVADYLEKLGIKAGDRMYDWGFQDAFRQKMEEVKTGIGQDLINALQSQREAITNTIAVLTKQATAHGQG